jgi:hypothetical protein
VGGGGEEPLGAVVDAHDGAVLGVFCHSCWGDCIAWTVRCFRELVGKVVWQCCDGLSGCSLSSGLGTAARSFLVSLLDVCSSEVFRVLWIEYGCSLFL